MSKKTVVIFTYDVFFLCSLLRLTVNMAQYVIPDPEDKLICPYDIVHVVRAKRFQYHLLKCRKVS